MDHSFNPNRLIRKILTYRGTDTVPYIERFRKSWVLNTIDELNIMQQVEKYFQGCEDQGIDITDFTKALLNIIAHEQDETLYITMGLIDLHKDICETFSLKDRIKVSDILNYAIENFVSKEWRTHIIPTRKIPEKKKFGLDSVKIREIDINAPIVYGNSNGGIMRLTNSKMITDSQRHNNNTLNRVCFSADVKKLFSLDSASSNISMYNLNGGLEKKISLKTIPGKDEILILDFAWSNRQHRIGATLKDYVLVFWDFADNFEYEMKLDIDKWVHEYQNHIWYLEFMNIWVTTDKTHRINVWDIEKEVKHFSLISPRVRASIIDIVVMDILKLVAVSSMDKLITLWDFYKKSIIIELDMTQGGIHTMVWSNTYQVLITAGYEPKINLWSFNPIYLDTTLMGRLEGHSSTITAIEIIEKTSMLVSVDDQWKIKLWDLRNLKCIQTLELEAKVFVSKIIDMHMFDKLCFISSRINFLEFDNPSIDGASKIQEGDQEKLWPIGVEYNFNANEIVICTRKDLRFIDVDSGRTKKLYDGLLTSEEDDITAFKLIHQDKKFILGDQRGRMAMFAYATGEKIKPLAQHTEEVNCLKVDVLNKMVISTSWDNSVHIQKEGSLAFELKRTLKNLHFNKETSVFEISVYHNLFVTATNSNMVYVWDYEFMKLMGILELNENTEPTCVAFINGYSYIILAESTGRVHLVRFSKKEFYKVYFQRIGLFESSDPSQSNCFVNKILVDIESPQSRLDKTKIQIYASNNRGEVVRYELSKALQGDLLQVAPHANTRGNYKPDRGVNENFVTQIKTYGLDNYSLKDIKTGNDVENNDLMILNDCLVNEFKAHKDSLTTLIIMVTPNKKLLTSSLDEHVKVWTVEGVLLASLNVNHPLPTLWNIKSDEKAKNQAKVLFALKTISAIFQRYQKKLLPSEKEKISIDKFLSSFEALKLDTNPEANLEIGPINLNRQESELSDANNSNKAKIMLMRDEYSPRDFQFDKAKHIYQKELQGLTLRQMEFDHKLAVRQKPIKKEIRREMSQDEEVFQKKEKELEPTDIIGLKELRRPVQSVVVVSKRTKALEKKLDKISAISASLQMKKGSKSSVKKDSLFGKSAQRPSRKQLETHSPIPRLGSDIIEEVETPDMFIKKTSSVVYDESSLREKIKLNPIKMPQSQREGGLNLSNSQKELFLSPKISIKDIDGGRNSSLRLDLLSVKSSKLDPEAIRKDSAKWSLPKNDLLAVSSKLDSIVKKSHFAGASSIDLRGVGPDLGEIKSQKTRNLSQPEIVTGPGSSTERRRIGMGSLAYLGGKGDKGKGVMNSTAKVESFDQFLRRSIQEFCGEAISPRNMNENRSKEKEGIMRQGTFKRRGDMSPTKSPKNVKGNVKKAGDEDFQTLEAAFESVNQFLQTKKPYLGKMSPVSPRLKKKKTVATPKAKDIGNCKVQNS